jgi:ABC-type multidrug transport system ATPase subunit
MPPVVELQRVTVRYGARTALQAVSAVFPPGAVGLLGPNGAGKSTMIRALLDAPPKAATVLGLDGESPLAVRGGLATCPE